MPVGRPAPRPHSVINTTIAIAQRRCQTMALTRPRIAVAGPYNSTQPPTIPLSRAQQWRPAGWTANNGEVNSRNGDPPARGPYQDHQRTAGVGLPVVRYCLAFSFREWNMIVKFLYPLAWGNRVTNSFGRSTIPMNWTPGTRLFSGIVPGFGRDSGIKGRFGGRWGEYVGPVRGRCGSIRRWRVCVLIVRRWTGSLCVWACLMRRAGARRHCCRSVVRRPLGPDGLVTCGSRLVGSGGRLMAWLKQSVRAVPESGVVPAAFLDPGARVWRDPDLFAGWIARHTRGASVDRRDVDPCVRFRAALDAWAVANDLVDAVYGLPIPAVGGVGDSAVPAVARGDLMRRASVGSG